MKRPLIFCIQFFGYKAEDFFRMGGGEDRWFSGSYLKSKAVFALFEYGKFNHCLFNFLDNWLKMVQTKLYTYHHEQSINKALIYSWVKIKVGWGEKKEGKISPGLFYVEWWIIQPCLSSITWLIKLLSLSITLLAVGGNITSASLDFP